MTRRHANIRLEEDVVPAGFLLSLIFAVVFVTLAGIGWAWLIFSRETMRLGGYEQPIPEQHAPRTIVRVNQSLIHVERNGQRIEAEQRRILEEYGWIDRERGIVRIPIDDAIRITAEGATR
ncbi:hypothetical protein [Vulgatibacter incomptus]|uniref:Uncharacterized protein n=1 Tax=Vulgatibacter incomptus TaxID=1391653 RepID=A0A0K1P9S3_9BACT|nr:hypothetical protein [Vulgatibacter incomptus]AKU90247.1 hypothetical protein AKJ08_0634 [Vulgatibacter incomptus]